MVECNGVKVTQAMLDRMQVLAFKMSFKEMYKNSLDPDMSFIRSICATADTNLYKDEENKVLRRPEVVAEYVKQYMSTTTHRGEIIRNTTEERTTCWSRGDEKTVA